MTVIPVVCGLIYNSKGQILLAQRAEPDHLKGFWEFPGGKIEVGEDPEVALKREIQEELALEIHTLRKLGEFPFNTSSLKLELIAYEAQAKSDQFQILDHLDVRWVEVFEIKNYKLSPADIPIHISLVSGLNQP